MEMEKDITKQSQEIPFFVNIINYLFSQEILKAGERQKQEQEDLDLETAALTNSNAALSKKTLDLENNFRKKEFQLKKDLDERERELKIDLLKFRREKAYEKYKGTCISVERYKPTEKDLVPVCRKCVELPDNPKREEEGLQPSQNSSPKIR